MGDLYAKRKATRAAAKRKERAYSEAAVENIKSAAGAVIHDDVKEAVNNIGEQWDTGTNKVARVAREVYQGAV